MVLLGSDICNIQWFYDFLKCGAKGLDFEALGNKGISLISTV